MNVLFLLILSLNFGLSAPLIEGGKPIPKKDKYKYFVRIESVDGYSCTATKVSKNKLITSAHCVIDKDLNLLYKLGDPILDYGQVKSINFHPNYIQAKIVADKYSSQMSIYREKAETMTNEEINKLLKDKNFLELKDKKDLAYNKKSQADIAFITLTGDFGYDEYPQIISKKSKFTNRGNIEIVGYGKTKKSWSEKLNAYETNDINLNGSIATSCWQAPPSSYEIEKLSKNIIGILSFDANIKHSISNYQDKQLRSQSALMPGDSGSSSIELDKDNKPIITGIASTVQDFVDTENYMTLKVINQDNKEKNITFKYIINNWGDPKKSNLEFKEIIQELTKLGLYQNGKIKEGIKLSREYERKTTVRFADLLHPDNQKFIKEMMR